MKFLAKYIKSYIKPVTIAPLFKFIETITVLIIPLLVANMIDIGVPARDTKYILTYGAIVVGLNVIGIVCAVICQKFAAKASTGIGADIRKDIVTNLLNTKYSAIKEN